MKTLKRTAAALLAAIMSIGTLSLAGAAELPVQYKDKTWDMSKNTDRTTHESGFEWDGLHIEATSEGAKTVKFDGTYLITQGGVNEISFKVGGSCQISVKFKSNNFGEARGITISDSSGILLNGGSNTALTEETKTTRYTGSGDTITLTPVGGGVSISEIKLTFDMKLNAKGDINGDKNVNKTDADMVLRHIAGLDKLTDKVMLNSADADINGEININDVVWILNHKVGEDTAIDSGINISDGVEVRSESALNDALIADFKEGSSEKKIYVMDDISFSDQIKFDAKKANCHDTSIIGVPDSNGNLPVLNFENMGGTNIMNASSSDGDAGILIQTANNVIKNVVVENAHDNGILIKGVGAKNNTVENCIVRYNNDSGLQVTGGACGTTLKGVYSYRNFDIFSRGGNSDGFAIKLGAGPAETTDEKVIEDSKTTCIDCYAWENSDDGWDSYDKTEATWTYRIDYINCMCWNNGNPENSMGYTDYKNNLPLDEKMPIAIRIKALYPKQYEAFKKSYNDHTLCGNSASEYYAALDDIGVIHTDKVDLKPSELVSSAKDRWAGNDNGFKFGSINTKNNSERHVKNCIAFDHGSKGFDQNNSGAKIWAKNCVAFNNDQKNYELGPYTAYQWDNIYGWNGSNALPKDTAGKTVSAPKDMSQNETAIRDAADRIISYAQNNTVVPSSIFTEIFG